MNKETYRSREDIAREYVEGVKAVNGVPSWDLLRTAVLYGMECAILYRDEFRKSDLLSFEEGLLGAKVGDVVRIVESGSGTVGKGFYISDNHVITGIDWTGHVEFDGGKAVMFRPRVQVNNPPEC